MMPLPRALMVSAVILATICAYAIPAYPGKIKHIQPDGSEIEFLLMGDERCHSMYSLRGDKLIMKDGFLIEDDEYGAPNIADFPAYYIKATSAQKAFMHSGFPTTGDMLGIVLLVNFSDVKMDVLHTRQLFYDMMNQEGYCHRKATGSVRDYFISQSMGAFTPAFDVIGPIELTHPYSYYGANNGLGEDQAPADMIVDACNIAHESQGVDFSKYDYDGDGAVDFVYVIYAGYAESYGASPNTIWPHSSSLSLHNLSLVLDGKKIDAYACSSELKYITGSTLEGIGTFCHEFSHVLGLPDIYNVFDMSSEQLGSWDIMDHGSYNNESHTPAAYSSFERYSLGWLEYVDIDTPAYGMQLSELTQTNTAYRIRTENENEFFTLENRQCIGWDVHQKGTGLMVLHIDYGADIWQQNLVNSGTYPRYDLIEADGTQYRNPAGDLFPGSTNNVMLTDYSTPSMLTWSGKPVGKGITNIAEKDGIISFDFMHDSLPPTEGISEALSVHPGENAIFFDLSGCPIKEPDSGIYVVKHPDGSVNLIHK